MKYYDKKLKLFSTFILFCVSILGVSQTPKLRNFHDTKGNIEVTKAGQLQYTLPIELPPGVKNVAPNISLVYVSGAGNGLAGYGWNISGITSISRVGKNLEKDGITKGVQLDYSDYYSFNGQRLILKSGEYGRDGAEYVTEKYSNIKVKSLGTLSGQIQGPENWEVTFEDGSQMWYGATISGNSSARSPIDYNIVKSKDANGNLIIYNYILENNVTVISSIEWGGNEILNTPNFNKIEFTFQTKPYPETAYIKGVLFAQSKLLQFIVVSSNNKQYKKYNISYKGDLERTSNVHLNKITTLNSKNEESNPAIFTYEEANSGGQDNFDVLTKSTSLKPNKDSDIVGDFDGDGNLDLLRYHSTTSARIQQPGVYLYKDFYSITYETENPLLINSSLQGLKDFIPTNFKKVNLIHNRQGLVGFKKITNPSTSKLDLEISFYSISEDNKLNLDFKKIIPNADYDQSSGVLASNGTRTTVIGINNIDFNGDGLNELILQMNDKRCWPIFPSDPNPTGKISQCEEKNRYMVIDPDQSIQNNEWYYEIDLQNNGKEDPFVDYRVGDFNGDGLSDFFKLAEDKSPLLITFKKNIQGQYQSDMNYFSPVNNATIDGAWEYSLVGDFNGDGLSDIILPETIISKVWNYYISKGNSFKKETVELKEPRGRSAWTNGINFGIWNPRTFVAYDINNDGKTELVSLESSRSYIIASQDNNQPKKYRIETEFVPYVYSVDGTLYAKIYKVDEHYVYLNEESINAELAVNSSDLIGLSVNQWTGAMLKKITATSAVGWDSDLGERQHIVSTRYADIAKAGRIKTISQGGVTTEITYKPLDKKKNPGLYDSAKTESYPYVEINQSTGIYVVSDLTQSTMSDKKLKQDFRYRGLTSNILGRGMIGFRKTARSSWYADGFENTIVWSGIETDPTNDGIPVKEWSIKTNDETKIFPADVSENNTQLLNFKSTTYQIDKILNGQLITTVPDASKAKVITAIVPKANKGKDFLTGVTAESTTTYGEYYLPMQNISSINGGYSVKTSTYEYINNSAGIGTGYYIGRLKAKTETVQAYNDTKSGKEEYTYENSNLKTIKKWNTDNTEYILDTYHYDGIGNIIQKVVSNSVDTQTQTAKTVYEAKGRFVMNKTDNLGLETQFTYNDWGQVLTQTDPLGNTQTNTYDDWGKLETSKNNLTGLTTYVYERDNNSNTIVTQSKSDGDVSKTFTNKLGQQYIVLAKASGQGQFITRETQYDILGRKVKESEPYFEGQNTAQQWNVMMYDDSVFPAKVNVTAFTGKQNETIVSGLTTTIKETNGYGRTTSKTKDALGNIISSTDKGGTIQFSYNALGNQIQAKYAENIVATKYDSWGRKSEFNDPSNGIYKYEYTGFGLAKKVISPKGHKEYTYNNIGQLISQKEFSTIDNGQTTNKTISFTYNEKGLLTKRSGILKGQLFSSALSYDPQGRLIASSENSNGKTYTEKNITFNDNGKVISYEKELQSDGILTKITIENIYNPWNGEIYQIKDKNSGKILWELKQANAKGQVLKAKLGGAEVLNQYDNNGFLTNISHSSLSNPAILQISYSFDAIKNELKTKSTAGDFNIVESFDYDDNNRLINWTNPITGSKPSVNRNIYDIKGRITENDQIGTMKFENSAKIYQPTGMTLNTAGKQNYDGDLIQTVFYNENNDPVWIHGEKTRVNFEYGLGSMRQRVDIEKLKNKGGGSSEDKATRDGVWDPNAPLWQATLSKFYNEDGSFEVVRDQSTGQEKHILYIEGSPYESNIIYLKNFGEITGSYKFLHKDYIGSILAVSDEAGNRLEQRHYDAWGNFTHLKLGSAPVTTDQTLIVSASLLIDRGYTSHEHFMEVGIIHMNGRLYDPMLRRFLNADENIQDPMNTQNYNKYGYVMNNPMMYNDPNGEFWWWFAGTLVGGYLSGVQANNGNWNPAKWDWDRSWSAVLGGAIGGAAISGALGNIASNAGAIKNFLPGIVSGGLNSAFNGGNFLGGAIGGISYSGNISGNSVTSTNVGYKYIVSPEEDNSGSSWDDLTKSILLNYVKDNFCTTCSYGKLQQKAGTMFENAFHSILGTDYSTLNYESNAKKFPGFYKGRARNTIPDGVYDLIRDNYYSWEIGNLVIPTPIRKSSITFTGVQFAEVKAMDGTLYSSSNQGQISSMIYSMSKNTGVSKYGGQFIIGTTSDTIISPALVTQGLLYKIQIIQMTAQYRMIRGLMEMRLYNNGASPSTSFIK